ncbi:hypothetical protein O181_023599 [Austropuccinia psidii MF-1]|uniref:Uncharacterized protein n=1 Tax=Austropuccinia psidii MF-1 TaxID=1389203 RepID=A0A9Q3CEQ3_9BASI|nr:hypothetical protein [Austropuccinia psidii MF-1]
MVGSFSNLEEISTHAYHLKLPSQWKSIQLVFHISLFGTSQDIKNPKLASRASSSNHHKRRRGMGSLSKTGVKAQEKKVMVSGGMERFQSRLRKIHMRTS